MRFIIFIGMAVLVLAVSIVGMAAGVTADPSGGIQDRAPGSAANLSLHISDALRESGFDTGAGYPVTADLGITEKKILSAPDGTDSAFFGISTAISGDTAIVGAYGAPVGGSNRGEAYIFSRNAGGTGNWGLVRNLTAPDATDGAWFGLSVAISGDTAIVGAYGAPAGGGSRGEAYIFSRNAGGTGNWGLVKNLTAPDATDGADFGYSVAISGNTTIIGANNAPAGGSNRGSAYIFSRNTGGTDNWGLVKNLTAPDATDGAAFGTSVAISGKTAIVGAINAPAGGSNRGRAYIFSRNKGGTNRWGPVKKLTAPDAADGAAFGTSVAISGKTAIVGAECAPAGGDCRGEAYVFSRNKGGTNRWGLVKKLTAPDAADFAYFGGGVTISGETAIVGAYGADNGGSDRGKAYIFSRNKGGTSRWGLVQKLAASDQSDGASFGYCPAISGTTVIVGAYGAPGGSNRGAAYIFS